MKRFSPFLLAIATLGRPCATIAPPGYVPASVASERALILWDAKRHTEHFIRSADFEGTGGPFGFLVPTPTPPRLSSPADGGFGFLTLAQAAAPRVERRARKAYRLTEDWAFEAPDAQPTATAAKMAVAGSSTAGAVELLSTERVGQYDAAVLRSDRASDLLAWLKRHRFQSDERLRSWLEPYVRQGWAITAFRYAPAAGSFESEPVSLSFTTDRPIYPYREPAANAARPGRKLQLYVLAPERMAGSVDGKPWKATTELARALPDTMVPELAASLGISEDALHGTRLHAFLDETAKRPDAELTFDRSPDQATVEPPPLVSYAEETVWIPKGLAATAGLGVPLLLIGGSLGIRRRRTVAA